VIGEDCVTTVSSRAIAAGVCVILLVSCGQKDAARPMLSELAPADWADAAATFVNAQGEEVGHAVMTNAPAGALLRLDLRGLTEGWHGIHFHNIGDCSDGADGFLASEGHVDPDEHAHGLLNTEGPERADLPNLYAGPDGRATAEFYQGGVSLLATEEGAAANGPFPLLDDDGFAVVVHENPDDHQTQPIGGAAARVACAAFSSRAQ
jgi:Cu-Zn family superoxide dismutase